MQGFPGGELWVSTQPLLGLIFLQTQEDPIWVRVSPRAELTQPCRDDSLGTSLHPLGPLGSLSTRPW